MGSILGDLRFGIRQLVRNRGVSATALLSLALGIGANTALFGIFHGLLWRPLPVASPDRLVVLYSQRDEQSFYQRFSYPEYRDYRAQAGVFDGLVAYTPTELSLKTENRDATRAFGELVTGNYFDVLGVHMRIGRGFRPDEDRTPGTHPVLVVSHAFWERRLDADPGAVGRVLTLNGQAFTVVGVAPEGFRGAYAPYFAPDLWMPVMMASVAMPGQGNVLENRDTRMLRLMGRLGPGVGIDEARAAVATIAARLEASYPDANRGVKALLFRELETRPEVEISTATNLIAFTFLAITGLVLLVACANTANLLLARAVARRREFALRLALGARAGQLVRQLLTESLLLSLGAGGLGLLLGALAMRLISSYHVPTDLPLAVSFDTDARVALFTLAISVLAAVAFGALPALRASRPDLVPALKGEAGAAVRRRLSMTDLLVVAQVATAFVLLVLAGLFVRSVAGARTLDPGFQVDRRVVMSFNPTLQHYDRARVEVFYRELLDRVRQVPGVASATLAQSVPLDFEVEADDFVIEGRPATAGRQTEQVMYSVVDEHYFDTLGTPLRGGRAFATRDTPASPRVAVINETMASRFWPGVDPLGKRFRMEAAGSPWIEVVGVAGDGKYRQLTESPRPYVYLPVSQEFRTRRSLVVALRRAGGEADAVTAVRQVVQAIDPAMPIFNVRTMDQFMERAFLGPKLAALLVGPAGALALIIAAVGLYGVMAHWVSRKTRELGIRAAIGASAADTVRLVMGQGLTLAAAGLVLGLGAALAAARFVAGLLFGVAPTDPHVFVGVPLLLAGIAVLATAVPARRAVKVDPLVSLRAE